MAWSSIQLGSREHYALPLALHRIGQLDQLITDLWLSPLESSIASPFLPSLASRRCLQIPDSLVKSCNVRSLLRELYFKSFIRDPWRAILQRNMRFQEWSARVVRNSSSTTVYSFSYTAHLPFLQAKKRNARCILGQIDPGPLEAAVVNQSTEHYRHLSPNRVHPPRSYWDSWREEIAIADKIIVNSQWSAKLLVDAGVPASKLCEVPLVYCPDVSTSAVRESSLADHVNSHSSFILQNHKIACNLSSSRRLKVLFLGSVILRKGVGQIFDAIQMLKDDPVDFIFAGPIGLNVPGCILSMSNVRFLGPVDRVKAQSLYRNSDVFLFPSLSDGFGLTQLEALGHGLPVIASTFCGRVVSSGINGFVLSEVTPHSIAEAIMTLVRDPDLLAQMKLNASVPLAFYPSCLESALSALCED